MGKVHFNIISFNSSNIYNINKLYSVILKDYLNSIKHEKFLKNPHKIQQQLINYNRRLFCFFKEQKLQPTKRTYRWGPQKCEKWEWVHEMSHEM